VPDGAKAEAIISAAQDLNTPREAWLNPSEWVEHVPDVVSGYRDRVVAKLGHEVDLAKRTLTNLYSARPAWLDYAHIALAAAVAQAYDWAEYTPAMPDEEIVRRLRELNLQRSSAH
jgi:hypothetical protein